MYYNRIIRVWVIDPLDFFLLSAIIGSLGASRLKKYLSEKKAMERLKNSIIQKSKFVPNRPVLLSSKEAKLKKIYRIAFAANGGEFENLLDQYKFSNEALKLAQQIKTFVERLARFLKEKELKGVARIFFKNHRLILDLILYKCRIDISYLLLNEGINTQVIIITSTIGGATGFALSWFSAGAILVSPAVLISTLLIRSLLQQITNQKDYSEFKKLVNRMLKDEELQKTLQVVFEEVGTLSTTPMEMKLFDSEKMYGPRFNFKSDQNLEEFIKTQMQESLGLVENPNHEEIEEFIRHKITRETKAKTVYFKDFIDEKTDFLDSDIINAEIIEKAIRVKIRNEEL